ncbi:MAG: MBL fold metallo-hydrolase [Actinobacteria bacterium]|nr:MBL fold metallo-hydrolase [Actinomycetota bacterium]
MSDNQGNVYFRQLLSGRDFAKSDPIASGMVNFCYLIGDVDSRQAVIVDPAYDPEGLLEILKADDMELVGVLATHYHPDHIGGDMMGHYIKGVKGLLEVSDVPVHIQADEAPWVTAVADIDDSSFVNHSSGDLLQVGKVTIELIHTPGHTPGSQCFFLKDSGVGEEHQSRLIAGDTLFLEGCGRVDLPGADREAMYYSITQRLARISDDTLLYPGHLYSPQSWATFGETRLHNYVFRIKSLDEWLSFFGGR